MLTRVQDAAVARHQEMYGAGNLAEAATTDAERTLSQRTGDYPARLKSRNSVVGAQDGGRFRSAAVPVMIVRRNPEIVDMSSPLATLQRDKQLALLTLDDGKANAFSHAMMERLNALLDEAEQDDAIRAVVMTGRDGRFSAGFDLSVMKSGPEAVRALVGAGAHLALRLYEFPKPVVIACSGHALAMGGILLFTADWRTGADGAFKIGMNEVQIGMTMPQFGAELARDRLSPRYFARAVVNAEIFAPSVAAEAGYLDEVVDALSVLDFACVQAERLAALDPRAFAATKRRTRAATTQLIREGLAADLGGLSGL